MPHIVDKALEDTDKPLWPQNAPQPKTAMRYPNETYPTAGQPRAATRRRAQPAAQQQQRTVSRPQHFGDLIRQMSGDVASGIGGLLGYEYNDEQPFLIDDDDMRNIALDPQTGSFGITSPEGNFVPLDNQQVGLLHQSISLDLATAREMRLSMPGDDSIAQREANLRKFGGLANQAIVMQMSGLAPEARQALLNLGPHMGPMDFRNVAKSAVDLTVAPPEAQAEWVAAAQKATTNYRSNLHQDRVKYAEAKVKESAEALEKVQKEYVVMLGTAPEDAKTYENVETGRSWTVIDPSLAADEAVKVRKARALVRMNAFELEIIQMQGPLLWRDGMPPSMIEADQKGKGMWSFIERLKDLVYKQWEFEGRALPMEPADEAGVPMYDQAMDELALAMHMMAKTELFWPQGMDPMIEQAIQGGGP